MLTLLIVAAASACADDSASGPDAIVVREAGPTSDLELPQLDGGCSGPGVFHYVDEQCGLSPDASVDLQRCMPQGDGRCYQRCTQDSDCLDPARPSCRIIGLFAESDYSCTKQVKVCRSANMADLCPV